MALKNQKYFWTGVIFTFLGIVFLAPWFYRDLTNTNAVGPFFGTCLAITFVYMGITRIKKSRQPDDDKACAVEVKQNVINSSFSFEFTEKKVKVSEKVKTKENGTPLFIKCVALSPLLPFSITILAEIGCRLLGFRDSTCIGYHLQEGMAYLGVLGWFVTLPIAGLLKLIYSSSKL